MEVDPMALIELCGEAFTAAKRITALVRDSWQQREQMTILKPVQTT
jgi:hypothetical protein